MSWSAQVAVLTLTAGAGVAGQDPSPPAAPWDARRAEHLLNRAGFGAGEPEIARALAIGPEALVAGLLAADPWLEEPFYGRKRFDEGLRRAMKELPEEEREMKMRTMRDEDRDQLGDFLDWWVERMLAGQEPLRERMTLFWHGHFTSSMEVVKSSWEMIQQNELLRRHALGSFRELLHGIARDPAMLVYLDNDVNRRGSPNENFARELLELFTLGEGHYSEQDVREVARAFTGWTERDGRFRFDPRRHDAGTKTVLGVEGEFDGDDVLEILLRQEACAAHLARKLILYFEGVEPSAGRLERYARCLREHNWRIDAFLRELFLDPDFYRDEVLGTRIASPIDFLVGTARRLSLEPPGRLFFAGASLLGERLFAPPGVQGWEGGRSWITTSSLLQRGNLAGALLGVVSVKAILGEEPREDPPDHPPDDPEMGGDGASAEDGQGAQPEKAAPRPKLPGELRALRHMNWRPRLNLTQRLERRGVTSDADLAQALLSECLAIPVDPGLRQRVAERLAAERQEKGVPAGELLARPAVAEPLLRKLAHEILSLPEAQLN